MVAVDQLGSSHCYQVSFALGCVQPTPLPIHTTSNPSLPSLSLSFPSPSISCHGFWLCVSLGSLPLQMPSPLKAGNRGHIDPGLHPVASKLLLLLKGSHTSFRFHALKWMSEWAWGRTQKQLSDMPTLLFSCGRARCYNCPPKQKDLAPWEEPKGPEWAEKLCRWGWPIATMIYDLFT